MKSHRLIMQGNRIYRCWIRQFSLYNIHVMCLIIFLSFIRKFLLWFVDYKQDAYENTQISVVLWFFDILQPIVQWINLPGFKSLELSTAIDKGPALLVLAPVNHVYKTNYYLNMVSIQVFRKFLILKTFYLFSEKQWWRV